MATDLHYWSLDEAARRIAARDISSVELTQAILDRIAAIDPVLMSYATLTPERALEDASALDAETAAGGSRGPLHGVPIAVKDLYDVAGVPTAAGMTIHRDTVPARDATVVARLRAAGAVILGKLQMTEGAIGTHHPTIPAPLNPWNAAYWTGVSSSGSGAATAAGLCFASLGSDTGGSIRFPSTMNGLSGLKPTWGRVSRAGVFALAESLDHVGPMCRSARDVAMMLSVIAGADPDDPTSAPREVPDYVVLLEEGIANKRLGVPANLDGIDDDATRAIEGAIAVLGRAGARVVEVALPPSFAQAAWDWEPLCAVEAALAHESTYPARAADYGPTLAHLIETGRGLSAVELARLERRRRARDRRADDPPDLDRPSARPGDGTGHADDRLDDAGRADHGDRGDTAALHGAIRHERPAHDHASRRDERRRRAGRIPDRRRGLRRGRRVGSRSCLPARNATGT